jgi:tetratricopeptide (TPR) repeat protein
MQVYSRSNASHKPNPSAGETNAIDRLGRAAGASTLEQLPPAMLAFQVGDLLEFDERSNLAEASTTTHAAMALGTTHPLYANLYAETEAFRKLAAGAGPSAKDAVKRARANVDADRARREKAERSRVAYADARKNLACRLQRDFAFHPRDVMQISLVARMLGELGRTDAAIQALKRGLELFPQDRYGRLQLANVLLQARPPVDPAVAPDPTQEAIAQARILKKSDPKDARPRVIIARALLLQARDLIRKGDQAGGRSAQAAALAELREEPSVNDHLTLAMIEHSLGHELECVAAMKTYLDGRRGRPVDARLAEVHAWRGEPTPALQCLEQVLERNIHDPGLCHVVHSRFMDDIHGDRRWLPLLTRMNRSADQLAAIPLEIYPTHQGEHHLR